MTFYKDPNSVLDYTFDWSDELDGDTIASAEWVVPAGVVKDTDSRTATSSTIWLSGGTVGASYDITNRITTTGGRVLDKTATWVVRNQ